ncbi:MAG: hypothetical protein HYY07_00800, partial [Elusimicrobia bacterium]|nr:hypothetical protein [Elusimicrobiota bacterium]
SGEGWLETVDAFLNRTRGEILQTYDAGAIQALGKALISSVRTRMWSAETSHPYSSSYESPGAWNDGTQSKQETTVYYAYNQDGVLTLTGGVYGGKRNDDGTVDRRTFGKGTSWSFDGFTTSNSALDQNYRIILGQAKLKDTITSSYSASLDGSKSWMGWLVDGTVVGEALTVTYSYDETTGNLLLGAGLAGRGHGVSVSDDGFTKSTSDMVQSLTSVRGAAKMAIVTTATYSESADGTVTRMGADMGADGKLVLTGDSLTNGRALSVSYFYDLRSGKLKNGDGKAASGNGRSVTKDLFDTLTDSEIEQKFSSIRGAAKLWQTVTASHTKALDSETWMGWSDGVKTVGEAMRVTYQYDPNTGRYKSGDGNAGRGRGVSVSKDYLDTETVSILHQRFSELNGQVKLWQSKTASYTTNTIDGTTTRMGLDKVVAGNRVLYNETGSENIIGRALTVTYHYNPGTGKLLGDGENDRLNGEAASGSGKSVTRDEFGAVTITQLDQFFTSFRNQARLTQSNTISDTTSLDQTKTHSTMNVSYFYNTVHTRLETGRWNAGSGNGSSKSTDIFGNTTESKIKQNYTAYRNAAKLQTSVTESLTVNADGSETYMGWAKPGNYYGCKELAIGGKALTVEYSYTDDGKLLSGEGQAAQGSGISETNDVFGNITRTVLDQRYTAVRDQAKLTHTISTS